MKKLLLIFILTWTAAYAQNGQFGSDTGGTDSTEAVISFGETGDTAQTGTIKIAQGTNITITRSGKVFTIAASLSGSGVWTNFVGFVRPDDVGDGIHLVSADGGDSVLFTINNAGLVTLSTPTGTFLFSQAVAATGSFIIGSADMNEVDLEKLDGITNGTGAANKALVLDAGSDITSGLDALTAVTLNATDLNTTGDVVFTLGATTSVTVDGRTNPREITVGAMRWNHTPQATTQNTRALFIDVDANSVPNTQGVHLDIKATGIAPGETIIGMNLLGDRNASTGGVIRLIDLNAIGVGSAEVHGIHIEPTIDVPLHLVSGNPIDPTQAWDRNGGYADVTVAFGSSGTDVTIFGANGDTVFVGANAAFTEVTVNLNTPAGGVGIKPKFLIWTGAAYTEIVPTDGSAGFTENGIIDMIGTDLSSFTSKSVNSVDKFYLVIVRTQAGVSAPVEDLIQTVATIDYKLEADGTLTVKTIGFEGANNDAFEHIIGGIEATADRTFNFPDDQMVAGDVLVASDASDLEYLNLATTEILIGDGSGIPTAVAMSGHATMDNAGVVTIDHGGLDGLSDDDHSAYENELNDSSGLRAALSDETGGTGLAVFNTNPTLTGVTLAGIIADNDDMVFEVDANDDGSNSYIFTDGTATIIATLDEAGNLQIANDLTVSGGDILTGNIAFVIGDGTTDSIDFNTDGTGTAEVTMPAGSIDGTEILDGTVDESELAAGAVTKDKRGFHVWERTTIIPDTVKSATQDTIWIGRNHWGVSITVDSIYVEADTDNFDISVVKSNINGSGAALVDAVQAITNGANHFYITETTITSATLTTGQRVGFVFSTDNANYTYVAVYASW